MFFFVYWTCHNRDLHLLTHSFPTRRSSQLLGDRQGCGREGRWQHHGSGPAEERAAQGRKEGQGQEEVSHGINGGAKAPPVFSRVTRPDLGDRKSTRLNSSQ